MSYKLNILSIAFEDKAIERAYREANFAEDMRVNTIALCIFLPLFGLYAAVDMALLENPSFAVIARLVATIAGFIALASMRIPQLSKHYETITAIVPLILSVAVLLIIRHEPDLDNTYYVAFIQGAVFLCFLVRVGFVRPLVIMIIYLAGFAWAAQGKPDLDKAVTQGVVLATMFVICAFGSYLLQRYRRNDFSQRNLIQKQNEQLSILFKDVSEDNKRKLAAMNMLVHFVKTPLHQIAGFSDILVNAAAGKGSDETATNARYIKNATTDLTKNVNALLGYHRLDETETSISPEEVGLTLMLDDFEEFLPLEPEIVNNCADGGRVCVDLVAIRAALQGLADHFGDKQNKAESFKLSVERKGDHFDFVLEDDARVLSEAQFADYIQPLTKLEGYLTRTGAQMPMGLRTVARAIDIMGGHFTHKALPDGNRYVIALPAAAAKAAAA